MKCNLNFLFVLFCIMLLLSMCTKDKSVEPSLPKFNSILIDTASTAYDYYGDLNISLTPYIGLHQYPFDMNTDGQDDIRFECHLGVLNGGALTVSARIILLHENIRISTLEKIDSMMIYSVEINDSTNYHYHETFGNSNYSGPYTLDTSLNKYPLPYDHGTQVSLNDIFANEVLYLGYDDQSDFSWIPGGGHIWDVQLGIWNNLGERYLGVRFTNNGIEFLGWICIQVTGHAQLEISKFALKSI